MTARRVTLSRGAPTPLFAGGAALLSGALVFWFLFTVCLAPFYVTGPPPGASEAAFRQALDREVPRILHEFRVPGMAIGTIVHGDPGPVYAYGLADKARRRPMTEGRCSRSPPCPNRSRPGG